MIMKTVQKGTDKIEHVEYGDNVIYFFSSRNRQGRTRTEMISKRITSRIMRNYTDEEYNTLLETVVKSARKAVSGASSTHI
jgi:hemerythrin-like domain-containing protein